MTGLSILVLYCFFASILGPDFAKLHISLSFFNFPVFIGEIVMLLCLGFSGWYIYTKKVQLTKLQCLFLGYLGFIVLWAGWDYFMFKAQALALRNATLFFYPIFAFFAYSFYSPSIFSKEIARVFSDAPLLKKSVQVFLAVILFLSYHVTQVGFYPFVYFILFLIVLYTVAPKTWQIPLMAAALLLWPYSSIFSGERTWLVSSVLTGAFLIFLFVTYFLEYKMRWKLLAGFIMGLVFLAAAIHFADKGGLKTLTTPMRVIQGYKEFKAYIQQREPSFHPASLSIHLYNKANDNYQIYMRGHNNNQPHNPGNSNNRQVLSNTVAEYKQGPLKKTTPVPQKQEDQGAPSREIQVSPSREIQVPPSREVQTAYENIYFRIFIWEDMMRELWESRSIFGVGLAHPQRSRSIEILGWAWGEWSSEGWITPHNSFLHLIYRAGIIGIGIVGVIFVILYGLIRDFIDRRSVAGIFLCGIIIYALIAANFFLILELPYYAIPLWSLFGLTMAYRRDLVADKR